MDDFPEQAAASEFIETQDRAWAANLGYGFAFYVYCSGDDRLAPSKYKQIAQMVAQPCQELGMQVRVLKKSAYSTSNALKLCERLTGELRLLNPYLACLFDFVWRVMLLLFQREDHSSAPQHERQIMETTLTRSARNANLLDNYSRYVIQGLAWEGLSAEQRAEAQHTFINWFTRK